MGFSGALGGSGLGGAFSGSGLQRFDTGLHRAQRTEIRQALLDRLGALLVTPTGVNAGGAGRYLRAVRWIPRPLRNDSSEELAHIADVAQGQAPAVCVALGRKTYEASGMGIPAVQFRSDIEVAVYVISANGRSREDGRLSTDVAGASDPKADPGIEVILEHIEELLLGQELNIKSAYELRPVSEDELATFGDVTVWEQRYLIGVDRVINPDRDVDDVLVDIEARNNFVDDEAANPVVDSIAELAAPEAS